MGYHPGYSCLWLMTPAKPQLSVSLFLVYFGRRLRFSRKRLIQIQRCYHCCLFSYYCCCPVLNISIFSQNDIFLTKEKRRQCADIALREMAEKEEKGGGCSQLMLQGCNLEEHLLNIGCFFCFSIIFCCFCYKLRMLPIV